jgi:excisionase family DNA binding protein
MGVQGVGHVIELAAKDIEALSREVATVRQKDAPTVARVVREIIRSMGTTGGEIIVRPVSQPEIFLTTSQVAAMYQVSDRVVRKWCESGRLRAARVGEKGEWKIFRSQFSAGPEEVRALVDTLSSINKRFEKEEEEDNTYER